MKKIIVFSAIAILFLTGCFNAKPAKDNQSKQPDNSATTGSEPAKDGERTAKFYPKTADVKRPEADAQEIAERAFVVTPELEAKFYLADKYDPGICFGLPGPTAQSTIDRVVSANAGLSAIISQRYGLAGNEDVYNKIQQINGIRVESVAGGKYQYSFVDGQCCTQKAYQGEITIIGQNISDEVKQQEVHQDPC